MNKKFDIGFIFVVVVCLIINIFGIINKDYAFLLISNILLIAYTTVEFLVIKNSKVVSLYVTYISLEFTLISIDDIDLVEMVSIIMMFISVVLLLFRIITRKKEPSKKPYTIGITCDVQMKIIEFIIILLIVICSITILLEKIKFSLALLILIPFVIVVIFGYFIIIALYNKKHYKRFLNDCNFEKFEKAMSNRLNNPRVSNFTKFEACNLLAASSFSFDLDKYNYYLEKIKEYKIPQLEFASEMLKFNILMSVEEFEELSKNILEKYKNIKSVRLRLNSFVIGYNVYHNINIDSIDVDNVFPTFNNKYQNAYSLLFHYFYYKHKNDIKSEEYKKELLNNYSELKELIKLVNK